MDFKLDAELPEPRPLIKWGGWKPEPPVKNAGGFSWSDVDIELTMRDATTLEP